MVRISQIELFDFKNIEYGKIAFPKTFKDTDSSIGADVVGIYGQNGSGKTSVVQALKLIKSYISGYSLLEDPELPPIQDFFAPNKNSLSVHVLFYLECSNERIPPKSLVSYELTLSRANDSIWASQEKISLKSVDPSSELFSKRRVLFELVQDAPGATPTLAPKGDWTRLLAADNQLKMSLYAYFIVQQSSLISPFFGLDTYMRLVSLETCNFNFYRHKLIPKDQVVDEPNLERQPDSFKAARLHTLIPALDVEAHLHTYFLKRVSIFDTRVNANCSLNILSMDIPDERSRGNKSHLTVNLFKPAPLSENDLSFVEPALSRVSNLVGALVPGLSIKMKEVGTQLLDDGNTVAKQVEFLSCRDGVEIPLRCESEGVRKLISLSLSLMEVHSYPETFVAIDELDSGVFEYLLGELLSVIDSFGRGQLLFTAHNLRVLELLPTSDIVLTTSDPKNRFVKFKGSRPSNNLRDQYLRSVSLGGESSNLYMPTDKFSIDEALCLGGDELGSI